MYIQTTIFLPPQWGAAPIDGLIWYFKDDDPHAICRSTSGGGWGPIM
jgi:hypothetical protein